MITLTDQIFLSLCLPLDSKLTNVVQDGDSVIVESLVDYLIRVDINSRYLGMEVDFLSPSGIYNINDFVVLLQNGGIINTKYIFKYKTSDDGLVENISGGGGGTTTIDGHVIRSENNIVTQRPNLTINSPLTVIDDVANNSTVISLPVDTALSDTSTNLIQNAPVSQKFSEIDGHISEINEKIIGIEEGLLTVDSTLSETSTNPVENQAISKTLNQILGVIAVHPIYVLPSATITNVTQVVENGTTLTGSIGITFTKNDAGLLTSYELFRNNVSVSTTQNTPYNETNIQSAISYYGRTCYTEGITKNNNLGIPDTTGKVLIGCVSSAVRTITPMLKCFYGAANEIPTTSAGVRGLIGSVFNNITSFVLQTGIVYKNFIIAIPAARSVTKVMDTTNNAELTNKYILINNNLQVADAGGTFFPYKIYALTSDLPYSPAASHTITII